MARLVITLACVLVVAAVVCPAPVRASYHLRAAWLDLIEGAAEGDDQACCYSAACATDHHCVSATCNGEPSSDCSGYSCYHCECCPCCGKGEYCNNVTSTPFGKGVCCPIGYKGDTCKEPICESGCGSHGACSAPNTCTCAAGWSGPLCSVPTCTPDCAHGNCTAPNTCSCSAGWSGATCDTPVCDGGCNHGNCTAPSVCTCDQGWTGTTCDHPMCPEGCVHGVCQSPSNCVCSPGWEGDSCNTCISDPFSWVAGNGTFTINSVELLGCTWKAGTNATVVARGVANTKVTAGTVQYRLYETGAQHFIQGGDRDYFQCTNKGCNPSEAIALALEDPTAVPTNFTLTFPFTMPAMAAGASPAFSLYSYGYDQNHFPYNFDLTIDYNYTSAPPSVAGLF